MCIPCITRGQATAICYFRVLCLCLGWICLTTISIFPSFFLSFFLSTRAFQCSSCSVLLSQEPLTKCTTILLNAKWCRGIFQDVLSSCNCRTIFYQMIFRLLLLFSSSLLLADSYLSFFFFLFQLYVIAHCNVNQIIFRWTSFCRSQLDVFYLFVLFCFSPLMYAAFFLSKRLCQFNIICVPCSNVMIYNLPEERHERPKHVERFSRRMSLYLTAMQFLAYSVCGDWCKLFNPFSLLRNCV